MRVLKAATRDLEGGRDVERWLLDALMVSLCLVVAVGVILNSVAAVLFGLVGLGAAMLVALLRA